MAYHSRAEAYEPYEERLSSFSSPYTPSAEFFSNPASPVQPTRKGAYTSVPVRNISEASTIHPPGRMGTAMENILGRSKSREQQVLWGTKIHWFMPTAMVCLLIAGILGSLGHHFFYASLQGKQAEDQLMKVRYGTVLAYFTKVSLVGSVVLAYRQRIWHTMRQKAITLKGIDHLFAVVEDPTCFASKEIYFKAKLATAMAMATWLIPIASILSPAALTAQLTEVVSPNTTCKVPVLNFTAENTANWREPKKGRFGHSLCFFNTTPPPPRDGPVWFDQPSFVARKLQVLATFSGKPVQIATPCSNHNCTWKASFQAPWYNCTSKKQVEVALEMPKYINYTYDDLAPVGNKIYFASSDAEEYARPQPGYSDAVLDKQGIFENEPAIWFGYVYQTKRLSNDSGVVLPPNSKPPAAWKHEIQRHVMRCELQKASYTVNFSFVNNVQSANVSISDGTTVFTPPAGSSTFKPQDPGYKEFIAYHSLGLLVRGVVHGYVNKTNSSDPPVTSTSLSQSRLLSQETSFTVKNFKDEFQNFFQEIVLTLLSEPFLEIGAYEEVPCRMTRFENIFFYEMQGLWVGYAISAAIALLSITAGGVSIYWNGITSDTLFSKILVTTRNRTLDKLVKQYEGVCLGGDPFPRELEQTQLRFGVIDERETDDDRTKHAAFGTVEETIPILRGDSYKNLAAQGSHYQSSRSWTSGSPRAERYSESFQMDTRYAGPG
ncbi:unnamed protein product [Tuber melanosporum]|uniref:(Perigord truffle) hypothetical protein n=1 Tax=Tuber melanosporum (strain Mel28) TaxID=656061 RepID=D5GHL7_TUBMM|nr:uncharacterized protein GSTUM_00007978001 [Tuber melanosporum]CAZ84010.1 unnamed protein product [Tuber melanosporum]